MSDLRLALSDFGSPEHGATTLEETIKYFPNFAAMHPDTRIQAYREFKPMRDTVEITLFYREPGKDKMRLDAEIDVQTLLKDNAEGVQPRHIKIIFVGNAVTAIAEDNALARRAA